MQITRMEGSSIVAIGSLAIFIYNRPLGLAYLLVSYFQGYSTLEAYQVTDAQRGRTDSQGARRDSRIIIMLFAHD
ncbi:hypothetical protein CC78DRAFT_226702 [Lojkania enalia]|uniref:Uncharacterized protein n=1 Tax=Lojkania enalia TaxID=147567 RepID=A0A9P4K996_9PLEO|nr:hypothetical protein CC78DRAFT_226702 [Didymosphaeria enalia]